MIGDITKEFEHVGVKVTIKAVWAGYEYVFDYNTRKYFAHYPLEFMAEQGAKDRIDRLILRWEV